MVSVSKLSLWLLFRHAAQFQCPSAWYGLGRLCNDHRSVIHC